MLYIPDEKNLIVNFPNICSISILLLLLLLKFAVSSFVMTRRLATMQVHVMLKELPEDEFGPEIDFREYSFFNNPLVSSQVTLYSPS